MFLNVQIPVSFPALLLRSQEGAWLPPFFLALEVLTLDYT